MTWWARGKQAHFGYPIFKVEHCSSLYSWFVACATHYAGAGIPNFEPFDGVETLSFWIKNKGSPGSSLPIRVSLERRLPKRVCNLIIKSPGVTSGVLTMLGELEGVLLGPMLKKLSMYATSPACAADCIG
jgi:hypothetical protein